MASDEMKDLRAKLTQEAINDHQMGMIDGTVSDLFSCEKCGSNKCTYKQVNEFYFTLIWFPFLNVLLFLFQKEN